MTTGSPFKLPEMPHNEPLRLSELCQYGVLDTEEEALFDEITELAAQVCQTPIALISLVDADRQWFKSHKGLDVRETDRKVAFCAHAILHDEIMEIADARKDPRFAQNPLVTGPPHIRFYAGVPLVSESGYRLGTLCVISDRPHTLNSVQKQSLKTLSKSVMSHLELRRKNSLLAEQSQLKSDFLSYVSHEVKTPLNAINSFSQLLLEEARASKDSANKLEALNHIHTSGTRLLEVVNSILDLRQMEAGTLELTPRSVKSRALFTHVFSFAEQQSKIKGVELTTTLSQSLPEWIYLDDNKFTQIVVNLLSNAIKFTPAGQSVCCNVNWQQRGIVITVKDNGPGISSQELEHLFTPFVRLASARHTEGSGLGMAITKALIDLMKGHIHVDSELGKGTSIEVIVPVNTSTSQQANPDGISPATDCTDVLVVEDNEINRLVMQALLAPFPCRVVTADTGEQAIDACENNSFGLILMDLNLPGMSGLEASQTICKRYPQACIVALTADSLVDEHKLRAAGISQKLTKPVDKIQLSELLKQLLANKDNHK
ncbi:response regulator [Alteromonas aestuariivivens]|uniref:histidine kinase n=1 Tax=Alteromonas aestuariivivens TaxID=1938339 RepID=A0A3D8ME34_9ALTE|nr:ATP-binding protein [Alteromonas aestuariivivens]RDV29097.1 response regulator [Alteromonas aestuariivivens]